MVIERRRARERAARQQLILQTAREIAETDGWDAVTTRRLAETIEYSQPVLYSHFANKDAIVAAVAIQGFTELAERLYHARQTAADNQQALARVAQAYLDFGLANPALYDAMFRLDIGLAFGQSEAPQPLHAGFDELRAVVTPLAGDRDLDTFTEVFWSALHGMVSLTRAGRLRESQAALRLPMLLAQLQTPPPLPTGGAITKPRAQPTKPRKRRVREDISRG
jgi:AcrR family transcriptional regulator